MATIKPANKTPLSIKGLTNDSVEFTPFVPLRIPLGVFGLSGAILAEVFGGFGCYIGEKFHFYSAERFACIQRQMGL